ncbi:MAG: hypothetical protein ABI370_03550 [Gammaproteobacteria bacterium]
MSEGRKKIYYTFLAYESVESIKDLSSVKDDFASVTNTSQTSLSLAAMRCPIMLMADLAAIREGRSSLASLSRVGLHDSVLTLHNRFNMMSSGYAGDVADQFINNGCYVGISINPDCLIEPKEPSYARGGHARTTPRGRGYYVFKASDQQISGDDVVYCLPLNQKTNITLNLLQSALEHHSFVQYETIVLIQLLGYFGQDAAINALPKVIREGCEKFSEFMNGILRRHEENLHKANLTYQELEKTIKSLSENFVTLKEAAQGQLRDKAAVEEKSDQSYVLQTFIKDLTDLEEVTQHTFKERRKKICRVKEASSYSGTLLQQMAKKNSVALPSISDADEEDENLSVHLSPPAL